MAIPHAPEHITDEGKHTPLRRVAGVVELLRWDVILAIR